MLAVSFQMANRTEDKTKMIYESKLEYAHSTHFV
jgi:hypothetical protein